MRNFFAQAKSSISINPGAVGRLNREDCQKSAARLKIDEIGMDGLYFNLISLLVLSKNGES